MILLTLLLSLTAQDTTGLSPRARAMLDRFPLPRAGEVSIATRFSTDTAWIGEQVELVTGAWFPRELRNRLRHTPNLLPPALNGLWSVQAQAVMSMAATRTVRGQLYDLFVAHQTLFPLGGGKITVPPAVLTYSVPASLSFFAPEQRKTLSSRPATLVVRSIPARYAAALGSGPTGRGFRMSWRGVGSPIHAGTPAVLELVLAGEGNIALWPAPDLNWPAGMRIYPDRTEERSTTLAGRRGGEKHFRFTVVADSDGVFSLPRVRYPYWDPTVADVRVAIAEAMALVVLSGAVPTAERRPLPVTDGDGASIASQLVTRGRVGLLILTVLPPTLFFWRRRRRTPPASRPPLRAPEAEFHALLGTRGEASPETVVPALRQRGVPRADAEGVRQWLAAESRRRYGPAGADVTPPPAPLVRVLKRLRQALRLSAILLLASAHRADGQSMSAGLAEYRAGRYHEAALLFEHATQSSPRAAGGWRNLAAAQWLDRDDIGASASWIRALELAPRDRLTREAWHWAGGIPVEVRSLAPIIPVSRDEMFIAALAAWLLAWTAIAFRAPRTGLILAGLALVSLAGGVLRTRVESQHRVLLRANAVMRVSPHSAAPSLGDGTPWSLARVERERDGWLLVHLESGRRGWLPAAAAAPLGPLD